MTNKDVVVNSYKNKRAMIGFFAKYAVIRCSAGLAGLALPVGAILAGVQSKNASAQINKIASDSKQDQTPFEILYKEITNSQPVSEGGVVIETPRLADNGHSAALRVYVDSPMSKDDFVKSIYLLSDRNPRPFMARFDLSPLNPRAEISTRVRLNGSQNVYALALTSKGKWQSVHVPVEVTESACLDAS